MTRNEENAVFYIELTSLNDLLYLLLKIYYTSFSRYEFNKYYQVKSIVPMLHLSWNLAKNLKISDPTLWEAIRSVLQRSLRHMILTIELVKKIKGSHHVVINVCKGFDGWR